MLVLFTAQSAGSCAGVAGGAVSVQGPVLSDFWSPMIRLHEPKSGPLAVKPSGFPLAVDATWKVVLPALVVALITK